MNLQEFSALKVGDTIEGMNSSRGTVSETSESGVYVVWNGFVVAATQGRSTPFFYSVMGTAWFHWTKVAGTD